MKTSRRAFLRGGALLPAGVVAGGAANAQHQDQHQHAPPASGKKAAGPEREKRPAGAHAAHEPSQPAGGLLAVETPDLPKLQWKIEGGVKVFHLIPEVVKREFLPGKVFDVWGFNGVMPGPMIEANEGDRVRIIVDNHLPESTSVHWHGLEVPIQMDGVPGLAQDPIRPGGRFVYEFTLHQNGTFFYHPHEPMQQMMGMLGLFVIHPKEPYRPRVDKDFGLMIQEFAILPNNTVPNSMAMEFNWLTINGKAGPATTPMIVRVGERVRIRIVNLGMDHHPMHIHGNTFVVTGTEAGRVPQSAWHPQNTVLVGVAQSRDFEFQAENPGDWMLHCHLPHHMMNAMVSMVGPMQHVGQGMHTNMGMEEGMGMLRKGHALSEELGPSFGRTIEPAGERDKPTTHMPLGQAAQVSAQQAPHAQHQSAPQPAPGAQQPGHMQHGTQQRDPWSVPGFPQDHFMPMDEMVAKPETHGLRPTWSAAMMGMMTLVRVLPPDMYDRIKKLQAEGRKEAKPDTPQQHKHDD